MDTIKGIEGISPRVVDVIPEQDYTLLVTFNNGQKRRYNVRNLFDLPIYKDLKKVFMAASVKYGTVVWPGDIDISPDTLYLSGDKVL